MKTAVDVLVGLIAVKELEIKTLRERIAQLQHQVNLLTQENNQLYAVIDEQQEAITKHDHCVGFKRKDE
jgi:hypothetical protein